jgi:peroxisomal membrane protein 4
MDISTLQVLLPSLSCPSFPLLSFLPSLVSFLHSLLPKDEKLLTNTTLTQQETATRILLNPSNQPPLSLLKALRNGLVYGTKVRFPHALVMILLFRSGSLSSKMSSVLKATRQHATNLATFAFLYKAIMLLLKSGRGAATPTGAKEHGSDSFLAGLLSGWYVFGRSKSSVNQQIVIYVAARVVLAAASLAVQPAGDNTLLGGKYGGRGGLGLKLWGLSDAGREKIRRAAWPIFASASWGAVMWLFRWYPDMLQPSLRSSMTYLYVCCTLGPFVCLFSSSFFFCKDEKNGGERKKLMLTTEGF